MFEIKLLSQINQRKMFGHKKYDGLPKAISICYCKFQNVCMPVIQQVNLKCKLWATALKDFGTLTQVWLVFWCRNTKYKTNISENLISVVTKKSDKIAAFVRFQT